ELPAPDRVGQADQAVEGLRAAAPRAGADFEEEALEALAAEDPVSEADRAASGAEAPAASAADLAGARDRAGPAPGPVGIGPAPEIAAATRIAGPSAAPLLLRCATRRSTRGPIPLRARPSPNHPMRRAGSV